MTILKEALPCGENSDQRKDSNAEAICCRSACDICLLDLPADPARTETSAAHESIETVEDVDDGHLLALLEAFERAEAMVEAMTSRNRRTQIPDLPVPNSPIKEATNGG